MKKSKIEPKETYCSMTEFEQKYFPLSYKRKLVEEKMKKPNIFGTGLAMEFLENLRSELSK